jgi:hypothetical protein
VGKFAGAFVIVAMVAAAEAQIPGGNIFFGYSNSGGEVGASDHKNFNGWEASLEGKFLPWIGAVADFSGHYATANLLPPDIVCPPACTPRPVDSRRYVFLLGPRASVPIGRFTPFAHAFFGVGHVTNTGFASDTSFATAIGGGLDYKLIKGVAWRFQGDELYTRFYGSTQNHFRFSTGIVLRF